MKHNTLKVTLSALSLSVALLASGQAMAVSCTTTAPSPLDDMPVWGGMLSGATNCATPSDWTVSTANDDITINHVLT